MIVVCNKEQLSLWKNKASKLYPKEFIAILLGTIAPGTVSIEKIIPFPNQRNTKCWVTVLDEDYEDFIAVCESKLQLDYIGSIHSHTQKHSEWHVPSTTDNEGCAYYEEIIFGIDLITKSKKGRYTHQINFWKPQMPLENVHIC